jgi:hypothetical protein
VTSRTEAGSPEVGTVGEHPVGEHEAVLVERDRVTEPLGRRDRADEAEQARARLFV